MHNYKLVGVHTYMTNNFSGGKQSRSQGRNFGTRLQNCLPALL